MKIRPIIWLYMTSVVLALVAVFYYFDFPFPIVFFLVVVGQALLIYTVYRILTDDYTTKKTFDDFYEDHSVE